jgi:cytochrome c-type biogenesis protein CcmE
MTPKQKRRLIATSLILAGVSAATVLAVIALNRNVSYLYSPSAVIEKGLESGTRFRLGGVVLEGSVRRVEGLKVRFAVTDRVKQREVFYEGILPDLFREGQSVIAHGKLGADGVFFADKVLAKHDETYMPKEVMEAMQRAQERKNASTVSDGAAE